MVKNNPDMKPMNSMHTDKMKPMPSEQMDKMMKNMKDRKK